MLVVFRTCKIASSGDIGASRFFVFVLKPIEDQMRSEKINEYLPKDELVNLTGCARTGAQAAWLREKGIAHRQDDRRVIVSRIHVRSWLEGRTVIQSSGLNLGSIK